MAPHATYRARAHQVPRAGTITCTCASTSYALREGARETENSVTVTVQNASFLTCLIAAATSTGGTAFRTNVGASGGALGNETMATEMSEADKLKFDRQWNAFMYTVGIICMYLFITTVIMVRNVVKVKKEKGRNLMQELQAAVRSQKDPGNPAYRSQLKKQICAHLIRMSQIQNDIMHDSSKASAPVQQHPRRHSAVQTDSYAAFDNTSEGSGDEALTLLLPPSTLPGSPHPNYLNTDGQPRRKSAWINYKAKSIDVSYKGDTTIRLEVTSPDSPPHFAGALSCSPPFPDSLPSSYDEEEEEKYDQKRANLHNSMQSMTTNI